MSYAQPYLTPFGSSPTTFAYAGQSFAMSVSDRQLQCVGLHQRLTELDADDLVLVHFPNTREHLFAGASVVPAWDGSRVVYTPAVDLQPGMQVPSFARFSPPVGIDSYRVPDDILQQARAEGLGLPQFIPLTAELGRALGALYADGWAGMIRGEPTYVFLSNREGAIADAFFADLWSGLRISPECTPEVMGHVTVGAQRGNGALVSAQITGLTSGETLRIWHSIRWGFRSPALARLVLGLIGRGANLKTLPDWVPFSPDAFRAGLVNGLLGTDACVGRVAGADPTCARDWNVAYTTTSPNGAARIVEMFGSDQLIAKACESPQTNRPDHAVRMTINVRHLTVAERCADGITNPARRAAFEWASAYEGHLRISVPTFDGIYSLFRPYCEAAEAHRGTLGHCQENGRMRRELLSRFLAVIPTPVLHADPIARDWLPWAADERLLWHVVQSVEPAPRFYSAIRHTRREGPDHTVDAPTRLVWPTDCGLFKSRDGFFSGGVDVCSQSGG